MSSRVTFSQINSLVQSNIAKNYSRLAKLQEQLSSGRKIQRPSDAPVDLTTDLQLRSNLNQLEQYGRNIDDGMSILAVTESAIGQTNDLFQRTRELAIQASNDTNTGREREFIMDEIRVIVDQLLSITNTTFKGSFLFSGTQTKTQPFVLKNGNDVIDLTDNTATDAADNVFALDSSIKLWDRSVDDSTLVSPNPNGDAPARDILPGSLTITGLTEGTDYEVDYVNGTITFLSTAPTTLIPGVGNLTNAEIAVADPSQPPYNLWPPLPFSPQPGNGIQVNYEWVRRSEKDLEGAVLREIDQGMLDRINTTVSEIHGDSNSVTTWDAVVKLMEGLHKNTGDTIRQSISDLALAFDRSLTAQATAGARTNRFEATNLRNEGNYIESTRLQSVIEDVDFAETISAFMLQEAVHTASLQAGARVIQPSLANFL
ncbi:flagellar hook-associated protein FlgL [Fibrobacterota bacterium]